MCGLAGVWLTRPSVDPAPAHVARRMAAALAHRGPDGEGVWSDTGEPGLALSHRRLAVIDPSEAGAQPMLSSCGRWAVTFNGEIYNFEVLRRTLLARGISPRWRGRSDTEVLVELIAALGVEAAVRLCDGMFAFAAWDRENRTLTLARDPFGEKPLYYGLGPGGLYFGSELGAIMAGLPRSAVALDEDAVRGFLRLGRVQAPQSILRDVRTLEPGSLVTWTAAAVARQAWPPVGRYWRPLESAARASYAAPPRSEAEAVVILRRLLGDSVRSRLVSDAPLGAMLSGGIDSALVAALAQGASSRPIRTFTVGFEHQPFDETAAAGLAAERIGSEHTTLRLTDREAVEAAPRMCTLYSEPFADPSQIPTYLVSRALRGAVTVALSGDGGDELFGGYVRHRAAPLIWGVLRRVPYPARRLAGRLRDGVGVHRLGAWLGGDEQGEAAGRRIKGLELIDAISPDDLYARLMGRRGDPEGRIAAMPERFGLGRQVALADTETYLSDDVLTKVDRASMAVGLEVRAPFLSRALFDFAWSLPWPWLSGDRRTKRLLRLLGEQLLPGLDWSRPKRGFAPPLDAWLRGPLREWTEDLVRQAEPGGAALGARALWTEHLSGRSNRARELWPVLMLQDWRRLHRL